MSKSSFDPNAQPNYFELFQRMVNPSGYPFQSLMFPVLDEKEIEKKILECATVRQWLQANIGLLDVTVKTLEYQKTLLTAGSAQSAEKTSSTPNENMNPALWAWNMMNRAGEQMRSTATESVKPVKRTPPKKRG